MKTVIAFAVVFVIVVTAPIYGTGSPEPEPSEFQDYGWSAPGFETDFKRMLIDPAEILSGGPPKDGIPAVDNPLAESQDSARTWLADQEPVILLRVGNTSRIYPLQILTWHEIVNDELAGIPMVISFCPLCNTGVVFEREYNGQVLDFGTTGRLRNSNLIMYDRQTETWWQQASGEAFIGEYAGGQLALVPALTLSFSEAAAAAPDADVLSRETGFSRPYGRNPYAGYDTPGNRPFLFQGEIDTGADAMDRVLLIKHNGEDSIILYKDVVDKGLLHIEVGGETIVVFHASAASSALDSQNIADGRKIGSLNAFLAQMGGRTLDFVRTEPDLFIDSQTGSLWNSSGISIEGELLGESLQPVVGIQHFWFSALAF